MEWFKHYNCASDGESCQRLIAEKDFETLYIYWWLLEQVSKLEKEDSRGRITLNLSYFKLKLGLNLQRTSRVLTKIAKTFNLEIIVNLDKTVEVFAPKWLELQENRGGKRHPKDSAKFEQKQTDLRLKNKELETDKENAYKQVLTDRSSTALFNSRFENNESWLLVLENFGLKKRLDRHIGLIKTTFEKPDDLELFINELANSQGYKNIMNEKIPDKNKKFRIEKYTIGAVEKTIGFRV